MREIEFMAFALDDDFPNHKDAIRFENVYIMPDGINCDGDVFEENDKDFFLCQYVGIKDNDGKKVYEGDIIRKTVEYNQQSYEALYEVIYEDTGFYLKLLNSYAVVNAGIIVSFSYGAFYVIGNIYENPELWKDKKYKK